MSLGPDDMPEDPFGESGMAQLICGCTSEAFKFVFTELMVRAVCVSCGLIGGEWPKATVPSAEFQFVADQPGTYRIDLATGQILAFRPAPGITASRDMLSRPQVGAAWTQPEPADVRDIPVGGTAYGAGGPPEFDPANPPDLPAYSSGMCNAYLEGGPYGGRITWLMVPSTEFVTAGMPGHYVATAAVRDGRVVYRYEE